jgi:hypothetical protein
VTDEELNAIEARANAATPGPWELGEHEILAAHSAVVVAGAGCCDPVRLDADANFICQARTDAPALVAEVRRLRAALIQAAVALDETCGWASHEPTAEGQDEDRAWAAKEALTAAREAGIRFDADSPSGWSPL